MRDAALAILLSAASLSAQAEQLTIDRMYGGGNLGGPVPSQLKVSPNGERVTFLRSKPDDQKTFDLWEYNVKDNATRMLVDSKVLAPVRTASSNTPGRPTAASCCSRWLESCTCTT
jgi:dipeptidyl-peptidase-4